MVLMASAWKKSKKPKYEHKLAYPNRFSIELTDASRYTSRAIHGKFPHCIEMYYKINFQTPNYILQQTVNL